jgi:hypothetical protein
MAEAPFFFCGKRPELQVIGRRGIIISVLTCSRQTGRPVNKSKINAAKPVNTL